MLTLIVSSTTACSKHLETGDAEKHTNLQQLQPKEAGEVLVLSVMPEYSSKLSSGTKRRLDELKDPETLLNLLIRTDGELSDEQRKQLGKIEANIRTMAGNIITISAPARAINDIVSLEFVGFVEISATLRPENP